MLKYSFFLIGVIVKSVVVGFHRKEDLRYVVIFVI